VDVLKSAVMLSLDSLAAAIAVGPLIGRGPVRLRLALLFGACDAAATSAAWTLGIVPPRWLPALAPGGLALYGAYLLALGEIAARRSRIVYFLPVLLCFDNLVTPAPPPDALVFGMVSAGAAYLGLIIGTATVPDIRRPERWAGAGVFAAGAWMLLS
jgi:putative Mn2+ efflux pump MntP